MAGHATVFYCTICGAGCPTDCFPTHRQRFVCHNTHCPNNAAPVLEEPENVNLAVTTAQTALNRSQPTPDSAETQSLSHNFATNLGPQPQTSAQRPQAYSSQPSTPQQTEASSSRNIERAQEPSISQIIPGLFIGNMASVESEAVLKEHGITAVVSVVSERRLPFPESRVSSGKQGDHPLVKLINLNDRLVISVRDKKWENLIQHFEGSCEFIEKRLNPDTATAESETDAREDSGPKVQLPSVKKRELKEMKAGVLVHCLMGISRSPTIVMAYLMWKTKERVGDVYKFVKNKRPEVFPNYGFLEQLHLWDVTKYKIWKNVEGFRLPCDEYDDLIEKLYNYKRMADHEKARKQQSG